MVGLILLKQTNIGLNNSFVVQVDTTAPVLSLSLTMSLINSLTIAVSGMEWTCGTDRGTLSVSAITDTSASCGRYYSYTVTCTDGAGNVGSGTSSFLTAGCGGGNFSWRSHNFFLDRRNSFNF